MLYICSHRFFTLCYVFRHFKKFKQNYNIPVRSTVQTWPKYSPVTQKKNIFIKEISNNILELYSSNYTYYLNIICAIYHKLAQFCIAFHLYKCKKRSITISLGIKSYQISVQEAFVIVGQKAWILEKYWISLDKEYWSIILS